MSRTLIDAIQQPIWTVDSGGAVTYVNRFWLDFTGLAPDEALGEGWRLVIHPDDVPRISQQWETSSASRTAYEIEYRLRRADGAWRWHRAQVAPIAGTADDVEWIGMAIDIHDRRLAERELRDSEARYREVIDHATDIVYTITIEGAVLSVNRAVEATLGYTPEELLGRSINTLIAPDQIEHSRSMLDRKLAGEVRSTYEIEALHRDGHRVTLEINNRLVESETGHTVIHGIARDVSERRMRSRQVELVGAIGVALTDRRPLDEQLSRCTDAIVEHLSAAFARIWLIDEADPSMLVLHASSGMYTHLDGEHARIPVGSWKIGRIAAEGRPHLSNSVVSDPEVHNPDWARREGMVAFAGYPLHIGDRVLGVLGLFSRKALEPSTLTVLSSIADSIAVGIERDRVERAQQEALEREREARQWAEIAETRYRRLFEGVGDAILVLGPNRNLIDANAAASVMLGYDYDELMAIDPTELIEKDFQVTDEVAAEVAATGQWQARLRMCRKDGSSLPVEVSATQVDLPDGSVFLSVIRDISERTRLEHLQRDFLAMVTHDLRSPLTAVKGQAQLLQRRLGEDARSARALASILGQIGRMEHLINDLADVVRLESGELRLRLAPVNLVDLAQHEMEAAGYDADGYTFRLLAPSDDVTGVWDRQRLGQVIQNLLSNAVKYSPGGGEILVRIEGDEDTASLAVIDHGVGIPASHLPLLFQRFYRADATGAGGLGLGLYITQMLVQAHGGTISASSIEGEGSEFVVTLPRTVPPRTAIGLLGLT